MADLNLENLQYKIANGLKITPGEQAFINKATDERGVPSRRKWTGIEEYPDSVIDFED